MAVPRPLSLRFQDAFMAQLEAYQKDGGKVPAPRVVVSLILIVAMYFAKVTKTDYRKSLMEQLTAEVRIAGKCSKGCPADRDVFHAMVDDFFDEVERSKKK